MSVWNEGFRPGAVNAFEMAFAPVRRVLLHGPLLAGMARTVPVDTPLLLVANHSSWWDGFILRELQRRLRPGSRFFTLMTDRELHRHPYLRWMGCVGLQPGSTASVLRAFRRLREEARRDRNSVFAVFPQGSIWPPSRRPLGFERGVSVLASLLTPATLVPVGIHLESLNRAAPTAFVSIGPAGTLETGQADPAALERAVETELNGIRRFLEEAGEDAVRLWPGADARLPHATHRSVPTDRGAASLPH